MWVCQRCQTENKETFATCPSCGTPRPAGRFGSAPQAHKAAVSSPRVAAAQQSPASSSASVPDARSAAYQASAQRDDDDYYDDEEMDRPRRGGSIFGKIVGGLLIALLPLLAGLLAWRQYDALSEALLPLYLTEKAPDWLRSVFYGALTAAAVLLSMLPGLWTILLSRKPPRDR